VGVSAEEQAEIWSVLAVLLHLGNIQCQSVVRDGPQVDDNYQQVRMFILVFAEHDCFIYCVYAWPMCE